MHCVAKWLNSLIGFHSSFIVPEGGPHYWFQVTHLSQEEAVGSNCCCHVGVMRLHAQLYNLRVNTVSSVCGTYVATLKRKYGNNWISHGQWMSLFLGLIEIVLFLIYIHIRTMMVGGSMVPDHRRCFVIDQKVLERELTYKMSLFPPSFLLCVATSQADW